VRSSCGLIASVSVPMSVRSSPNAVNGTRHQPAVVTHLHRCVDFWWSSSSRMVLPCSPLLRYCRLNQQTAKLARSGLAS